MAAMMLAHAAAGASALRVKTWTTDDGLPANRISALKQTRHGYLWIGTWFGLVRFDGARFTVFNKGNTAGMVDDTINAMAEDDSGILWIGTKDGLLAYRDRQFKLFSGSEGLPAPIVNRLLNSRSGGVWVHAGLFISKVENDLFSQAHKVEFSPEEHVVAMHEGTNEALQVFENFSWLSVGAGGMRDSDAQRVEPGELRTNHIEIGSKWLATCPAAGSNSFWIGTAEGLLKLEGGTFRAVTNLPFSGAIDFVFRDRAGGIWINSRQAGLFRHRETSWEEILPGGERMRSNVICMEQDFEGSFWLGTEHGLIQMRSTPVRTFTVRDGLPSDNASAVCEDEKGAIWVATDKGLGRISGGTASEPLASQNREHYGITSVWPAPSNGVWFAEANRGLRLFRSGRVSFESKERDGLYSALYRDRAGRILASVPEGVAEYIEDRAGLPVRAGLISSIPKIACMLEDAEGSFWFGTAGEGLLNARAGKLSRFTLRDGLSDERILCICQDNAEALWLGTENGLTRYQNGKFFAFSKQCGLIETTINCILEDDLGCLWLSGLKGVHRFRRADLEAVAEGHAGEAQGISLGTADGMESAETNGDRQPAGWKARDGRLWFPTIRGVVVIDPKAVPPNQAGPPVLVEKVRADNEVVSQSSSVPAIRAGHGHVIEFNYTANTFIAPEQTRFKYRLAGVDPDWRGETTERTAHYVNLKPGNYRFEVMAKDHHNVWSSKPARFRFSIAPHFWQTWPFYMASTASALAFILGLHHQRVRSLGRIQRLEQQRELQQERARIARDLHDDLGANLTGVALQLDLARSGGHAPKPLQEHLGTLAEQTRGLVDSMREVVWAMNPQFDNLDSLATYLGQYTESFAGAAGLRCRLELPDEATAIVLTSRVRHQIFLIVKEALHNVVRHARATEVRLRLDNDKSELHLTLADNGCGIPVERLTLQDHGLANMQKRIEALGGTFSASVLQGGGTEVAITLPLHSTQTR